MECLQNSRAKNYRKLKEMTESNI